MHIDCAHFFELKMQLLFVIVPMGLLAIIQEDDTRPNPDQALPLVPFLDRDAAGEPFKTLFTLYPENSVISKP